MAAFCSKCGTEFKDDAARFCSSCGAARGGGDPVLTKKSGGVPLVALVIGIALAGVVPFFLFSGGLGGGVEGSLVVTNSPYGSFTFTPTGCASMQPYGRFGANLHGDGPNDGGLYLSMDPVKGAAVDVEVPGSCRNADGTDCTVFALPRDLCETYQVQVEFNGVVVNDVRQVRGTAALKCALPDGTTAAGTFTFGGC